MSTKYIEKLFMVKQYSRSVLFSNPYNSLRSYRIKAFYMVLLVTWGEEMIAFFDSRFKIGGIKFYSFYGK